MPALVSASLIMVTGYGTPVTSALKVVGVLLAPDLRLHPRCGKENPVHNGLKRKLGFTVSGGMLVATMRPAKAIIALGALGFLLNGPEAAAQASGGAMGPRSRAEVRISVSVLPRFEAKTVSRREGASKDAGGVAVLAINGPKLRYSVVGLDSDNAQTRSPRLLLVVPD